MGNHAVSEANRCLKCKKPLCREGCPINTNIPELARMIQENEILGAGEMLYENNPLSIICAHICPHEKQCEGHCVLNRKGEPINISSMETYVSDYYLNRIDTNIDDELRELNKENDIAIVGSGPSGLTLALIMAQRGYPVTIFENHEKIGGVLRYGIPEFRLPKTILDRLYVKLQELGVVIRPNILIGPNITLDNLFRDGYKAIFVGTGVWKPKLMGIKGESLGNVHFAIDYLKNPEVYNLGKRVVTIGGGNVAMDAARTAIRNGADESVILYRKGEEHLPALKDEINYTKLDGVKFEYYKAPKEISKTGLIYNPTCFEKITDKNDNSKNIKEKFVVYNNVEGFYEADSIIIAISQGPQTNIVSTTKGIDIDGKGLIVTDEYGKTTREGVFAAGDVVSGARTVVEAVNLTKKTADIIEEYIKKITITAVKSKK
jgi:glutamate synthase (NADPH/NADH) small chain